MGPPVFSQIASVVEALLTNGAGVASRCLVLLIGMFSDVIPLEVVSSVKVLVAHLTRKATSLTMNVLCGASSALSGQRSSWLKRRTRASLCVSWEEERAAAAAAVVAQQSHWSEKPLNRRVAPISGCESTHFGWKNPSSFPPKDCALLHVDFLSRYDDQTQRRRVSKIGLQRRSHMNYFIYSSRHFTPHGRYELSKLTLI